MDKLNGISVEHTVIKGRRLRRYRSNKDIQKCGSFKDGVFTSRWYQGLEDGMEWLRLSLSGVEEPIVRVYASDERSNTGEPAMVRTSDDLLLYGVRGRFLRFTVEPAAYLSGFELTFPGNSIDMGLPAVMQDDIILKNFLGVYQSVYLDYNRNFEQFPERIDPQSNKPLPGLERWLGAVRWMRNSPVKEKLLTSAVKLNRMRGTLKGLKLLLEIVVEGRAGVVEPSSWGKMNIDAREKECCTRLYGDDTNGVTLLLPDGLPKDRVRFLKDVMEDFIPAGIGFKLIQLENGAPIDGHCYLDENAQFTEAPSPMMDEIDIDDLVLE